MSLHTEPKVPVKSDNYNSEKGSNIMCLHTEPKAPVRSDNYNSEKGSKRTTAQHSVF